MNWYFTIDNPGRKRLLEIFKETGTDLVISGHVHCYKVNYADGIKFVIAPANSFIQNPNFWDDCKTILGFLKYDVTDEGIIETLVPLRKTYNLKGYGPGGHPAPHMRDYSLRWDKS